MKTLNIPLSSLQNKPYLWAVYATTDSAKSHDARTQEVETLVKKRSKMWHRNDIDRPSPQEWLDTLDEIEAVNNLYRHIIIALDTKPKEDFDAFSLFFRDITVVRRISSADLSQYVSKHSQLKTFSLLFPIPENYHIYKLPDWKQA